MKHMMSIPGIYEVEADELLHERCIGIYDSLVGRFGTGGKIDPAKAVCQLQKTVRSRWTEYIGRPIDGVTLTAEEVCMICGGGFNHNGASITVYPTGAFFVKVFQ
jgi:hypothetical protein